MKDVDTCSRHLNTLVYKYRDTVYYMRRCGVIARPYAYSYNVFYNITNLRRVTAPNTTLVTISSNTPVYNTSHCYSLHFFKSLSIFHMSM